MIVWIVIGGYVALSILIGVLLFRSLDKEIETLEKKFKGRPNRRIPQIKDKWHGEGADENKT